MHASRRLPRRGLLRGTAPLFLPVLLALLCAPAPPLRADSIGLRLTEVVTDPQGDHSENTGGNGVPFDALPGEGAISSVDEYVELHFAGGAALDLRGYVLDFLDTTPTRYVFGAPSRSTLRFTPGSRVDRFLAGGFLVLGNPPGALNNRIDIELRNPLGDLVDRWSIADGNATGPDDEALARVWTGTAFLDRSERAAISPLGPGPTEPTPEPGTLLLCLAGGLTGLFAAARPSVRRACSAMRRTPRAGPRPCRSPGPVPPASA